MGFEEPGGVRFGCPNKVPEGETVTMGAVLDWIKEIEKELARPRGWWCRWCCRGNRRLAERLRELREILDDNTQSNRELSVPN